MTRQIEFRAWDKIEKMWCNSFLVSEKGYITTIKRDEARISFREHGELILMQFTGLLDKNGKEIFEGDIVEVRIPEDYGGENELDGKLQFLCRQEVKASGNSGGYYTKEDTGEYCPGLGSDEIETEIIGNIYENKDLLK